MPRAVIVPFPRTQDRRYVERHASRMIRASSAEAAESWLRHLMKQHGAVMRHRGVAEDAIRDEIATLEAAIRREAALFGRRTAL